MQINMRGEGGKRHRELDNERERERESERERFAQLKHMNISNNNVLLIISKAYCQLFIVNLLK